jgi:hypothetical protein
MERWKVRVHWIIFAVCSLIGLSSAVLIFAVLAMMECLPRDGSPLMHACDLVKRREVWLYPLLLAMFLSLAVWLQMRGHVWGNVLGALSGVAALCLLILIEQF